MTSEDCRKTRIFMSQFDQQISQILKEDQDQVCENFFPMAGSNPQI